MPRKTKDLAAVLRQTLDRNPALAAAVVAERFHARLASDLYEARRAAGLTQQEVADRAGTKQPVVARLEDADYEGHSLKLLRRIAAALGKCVQVSLVDPPTRKRLPSSRTRMRKTGS